MDTIVAIIERLGKSGNIAAIFTFLEQLSSKAARVSGAMA